MEVLLVDPHPVARRGLARILQEKTGRLAVCGEAPDLPRALEALEILKLDLIVTEQDFRGGGGLELVRRLRRQDSDIPIPGRIGEGPRGRIGCSGLDSLTDRQLQVFRLLGEGNSTRETAEILHLSPKTLETHRANIMEKLGLESATQLLHHAVVWSRLRAPDLEGGPP